jgi:hypothetical protein
MQHHDLGGYDQNLTTLKARGVLKFDFEAAKKFPIKLPELLDW